MCWFIKTTTHNCSWSTLQGIMYLRHDLEFSYDFNESWIDLKFVCLSCTSNKKDICGNSNAFLNSILMNSFLTRLIVFSEQTGRSPTGSLVCKSWLWKFKEEFYCLIIKDLSDIFPMCNSLLQVIMFFHNFFILNIMKTVDN